MFEVRLALKELHWLPLTFYKVSRLMFTVYDNHCPVYLRESVISTNSDLARQHLRSASSLDFIVPRTRTKFGD